MIWSIQNLTYLGSEQPLRWKLLTSVRALVSTGWSWQTLSLWALCGRLRGCDQGGWSPNSTHLYFCQQTNAKDIAGQSAMIKVAFSILAFFGSKINFSPTFLIPQFNGFWEWGSYSIIFLWLYLSFLSWQALDILRIELDRAMGLLGVIIIGGNNDQID